MTTEPTEETGTDDTAEHEPVTDEPERDQEHLEIPDDADVPPGNEPEAVGEDGRQDEAADPSPADAENGPREAVDGHESDDEPESDPE